MEVYKRLANFKNCSFSFATHISLADIIIHFEFQLTMGKKKLREKLHRNPKMSAIKWEAIISRQC